jgi:hypothetical protein
MDNLAFGEGDRHRINELQAGSACFHQIPHNTPKDAKFHTTFWVHYG